MITVDKDKVRKATGISDVSATPNRGEVSDAQITYYNEIADRVVKNRTDFELEETEVTENYDSDGTGTLILKKYPVSSIISLKDSDTEIEAADYHLYADEGKIVLAAGAVFATFPTALQTIEVNYKYYDSTDVAFTRDIMFYMVCIDVLVDAGNDVSEGISRYEFEDYEVSYQGMPYGTQIKHYQAKLDRMLTDIGHRVRMEVL